MHACCGPYNTVAVPYLRAAGLEPLAFFANPNIQPPAEHDRRLQAMRRYAEAADLALLVDARAASRSGRRGRQGRQPLPAPPPAAPTPASAAGSVSRCA